MSSLLVALRWTATFASIGAVLAAHPRCARGESSNSDAREAFELGTKLVKEERWAEALAAFERASATRPHATTTFNVAFCLRALGRYTAASRAFRQALVRDKTSHELAGPLVEDARAFEAEMSAAIGRVTLVVDPVDATVSIDGRSLVAEGTALFLGGEDVDGAPLPAGKGTVVLDPGRHLVTLSHAGYARASTAITVAGGARFEKRLDLARLPATLGIDSTPSGAAVRIENIDVGLTPVTVERPPGSYHVALLQAGYRPYETTMKVAPGQHADVRAALTRETPSLLTRWWFWTTVGVVAAGAAVTTYLVTRPEEPLTGGGLGWVAGR